MPSRSRRSRVLFLTAFPLTLLPPASTFAGNKYYIGPPSLSFADWYNTNNWSATSGGASGNFYPTTGDDVFITGSNGVAHTVSYDYTGPAVTLGTVFGTGLTIDLTGAGTSGAADTLAMGANTLTVAGAEVIGLSGNGTLSQTGGTNSIINGNSLFVGGSAGSVGNYNFGLNGGTTSNGTLSVASNEAVGFSGTGNFTQISGTHTVGGVFYLGYTANTGVGTFTLSNGSLAVNGADSNFVSEYVGYSGQGTFTQSVGTNTLADGLTLGNAAGSTGSYTLSSGVLTVDASDTNSFESIETIGGGGTATFIQQGGTHNVGTTTETFLFIGRKSVGSYTMNNNSVLNVYGAEFIGIYGGTTSGGIITQYGGSFIQNGGTHTASVALTVGDGGTGSYTLNGGNLAVATDYGQVQAGMFVAASGTGLFTQTGGTCTVGTSSTPMDLVLGDSPANPTYNTPAALGTYTINNSTMASTLMVYGNVELGGDSYNGAQGIGVMNISAGTVTVGQTLKVWNTAGSMLNLSGGVLNVAALDLTGNLSHFNWTGGTLNFTTALTIDSNFVLGSSPTIYNTLSSSVSLTNNAAITLAGGTISSPGSVTNNGLISGYGTLAGTGGFTNNDELQQSGGDITLTNSGTNFNYGTITLAAGNNFIFASTSAGLYNRGTINLNGGTLNAGVVGMLNGGQSNSGTLAGRGTVSGNFYTAAQSTISAQGGTLNIVNPFTNNGAIQVLAGATLAGGAITNSNSGTIEGNGTLTSAVANSGTLEAMGGAFNVIGAVSNNTGGILTAALQNELDLTGGLSASNIGTVSLAGGTIKISGNMTNSAPGQIIGYGVLTATGLTNTSTILFAGGSTTINGPLTNNTGGTVTVQNAPVLFTNLVTNNATFTVTGGGTATFAGGYTGGAISPAFSNTGTFTATSALVATGNFTNSGNSTLGGSQNWLAGTTFTNTAGSATFLTDTGSSTSSPLSINATGGAVTFSSTQHLAALTIVTGATVTVSLPTSHAARSVIVTPLSMSGGKLDLTANDLIEKGASPLAVFNQLKTGFNSHSGYWNGSTGIVSSAAAADTTHLTTLGYRIGGSAFDGISTTTNDVLVKYTYYGDANLDGSVNGGDYEQIDNGFGMHLTGWQNGDFNYDGVVDGSDYSLIDNTFNQINATGAMPLVVTGGSASLIAQTVPEPATTALLGVATLGMCVRRRRRG